jgi:hypothetical protein
MVGAAGADGLGDPMSDALGDALGDPNADAAAELDAWDAVPPVLLEETHPTTVTIATKATGGAAILKGVLRQNGSGRLVLVPMLSPPPHVATAAQHHLRPIPKSSCHDRRDP